MIAIHLKFSKFYEVPMTMEDGKCRREAEAARHGLEVRPPDKDENASISSVKYVVWDRGDDGETMFSCQMEYGFAKASHSEATT